MIYYCEKCDCYYTEEELKEKEICYRFTDIDYTHWETILTCPNCGNEDLKTFGEYGTVDLLNNLKKGIR